MLSGYCVRSGYTGSVTMPPNNPFYRGASGGGGHAGKNPFNEAEYEAMDQLRSNYFDTPAGNWLNQSAGNEGIAKSFQTALESSRMAAAKILPRVGLVGESEFHGFRNLTTGSQVAGDWQPGGDSLKATNISFAQGDHGMPGLGGDSSGLSLDKLKAALAPGSGVSLSSSGLDKFGELGGALSKISGSLASGDISGVMDGLNKLLDVSNAMNPHGGSGMQQFMELLSELLTVLPQDLAAANIDLYGLASEVADEYLKTSAIGAASAARSI